MTNFSAGSDHRETFKPNHLLDPLLLFTEPLVEIGARGEMPPFQTSMPASSRSPLASNIADQQADQYTDRHYLRSLLAGCLWRSGQSLPPIAAPGHRIPAGMHRIQGENASCDHGRGEQCFECAALICFLTDIAVPQDNACRDIVTHQLMNATRLATGCRDQFSHQEPPVRGRQPFVGCATDWVAIHSGFERALRIKKAERISSSRLAYNLARILQ